MHNDSTPQPFIWKGKALATVGDIGDALCALESPGEAREFMQAYSAITVHAYRNVGYIAGYYEHATMQRILEWCETAHPIFGRTTPTPEAAFEAGQRLASELQQ